MLAGEQIMFVANTPRLTAMSAMETEHLALAYAAHEGLYFSTLLRKLNLEEFHSSISVVIIQEACSSRRPRSQGRKIIWHFAAATSRNL